MKQKLRAFKGAIDVSTMIDFNSPSVINRTPRKKISQDINLNY